MITWWSLILGTILFLLLEGFFAGAEMALVSADKIRLKHEAHKGSKGAKIALHLTKHPEWLFSATLLGQNLFIVANSTMLTFFIFDRWGVEYELFGLILCPVVLIFGEAVPKGLFQQSADRLAPIVSPIVLIFSYVFYPVVWLLSNFTKLLMGGMANLEEDGDRVTRESLEMILRETEVSRDLPLIFKGNFLKIFSFVKKEAREVMTPLIEVVSLRDTATVAEAIEICSQEGYSWIPIFHDRAYNIIGVVHFRDLLFEEQRQKTVASLMLEPLYVPPTMGVKDLYMFFQSRNRQFAVVIDEFGSSSGIVTTEDVAEAVLGPIQDEYDDERSEWRLIANRHYVMQGRVTIEEINDKLKWGLPKGTYETIAGLLLQRFKRYPQVGESIEVDDLTITVRAATARSIDEVLVDASKAEIKK